MIGYFNTYIQRYWEDNRKVQTYTELGLSLLLMVIFLAFAIRPTLNTVLELNKKLNEARQANQRLEAKIQSISRAQANLQEVEPRLSLVDEAVPQKELVLDFLNQVQLLAGQYNLALTSLVHNEGERLNFTIAGSGAYPEIKSFVSHLEELPRLAQLDNLQLALEEENLEFSFEGEIFYQNE